MITPVSFVGFLGLAGVVAAGDAAWFVEVPATTSGLAHTVVYGSDAKDFILETNGPGIALADFDGDGDLDVFCGNGDALYGKPAESPDSPCRLFRNDGDLRFVDVTADSGITIEGFTCGVAVVDFDADGRRDLFIARHGRDALLRNVGALKFEDASTKLPDDDAWGASVAAFDADGDGDLDLYETNYLAFDLGKPPRHGVDGKHCTWFGHEVMCGPEGLTPQSDRFLRNDTGAWVDATKEFGFGDVAPSFGLGVLAADFDGDGHTDVYVANDSMPNFLFWKRGSRFEEDGLMSGAAVSGDGREQAGMGLDVGDVDGDGRLDVFVTNFSAEPNTLYRNDGDGFFDDVSFRANLGPPSLPRLGWGAALLDFDRDGDLDAFTCNGHVYPQADRPGTDTTYRQPCDVFTNEGGVFKVVTPERSGLTKAAVHRAAAFGDLDDDGDDDVVVITLDGPVRLLRNDVRHGRAGDPTWIGYRLDGGVGNPDGVGATVTLGTTVRVAKSSYSFQAANDPRVAFAGAALTAPRVVVRWSDGSRESYPRGALDAWHALVRGEGTSEP